MSGCISQYGVTVTVTHPHDSPYLGRLRRGTKVLKRKLEAIDWRSPSRSVAANHGGRPAAGRCRSTNGLRFPPTSIRAVRTTSGRRRGGATGRIPVHREGRPPMAGSGCLASTHRPLLRLGAFWPRLLLVFSTARFPAFFSSCLLFFPLPPPFLPGLSCRSSVSFSSLRKLSKRGRRALLFPSPVSSSPAILTTASLFQRAFIAIDLFRKPENPIPYHPPSSR